MVMRPISYARHRFPSEVICHAVWLYLRFTLSYRDVEDLLAARGLGVSYETIRRWVLKFGPAVARNLRLARPKPDDRWHLYEMVVSINGQRMYLWRAVDSEGDVLDILVQRGRDKTAALNLLRKLLKRNVPHPQVIVTDKLRSYGAALRELGFRAYWLTIELRTHVSRYDDGTAKCRASSRPGPPNVSSPLTPPSTTPSMSSV